MSLEPNKQDKPYDELYERVKNLVEEVHIATDKHEGIADTIKAYENLYKGFLKKIKDQKGEDLEKDKQILSDIIVHFLVLRAKLTMIYSFSNTLHEETENSIYSIAQGANKLSNESVQLIAKNIRANLAYLISQEKIQEAKKLFLKYENFIEENKEAIPDKAKSIPGIIEFLETNTIPEGIPSNEISIFVWLEQILVKRKNTKVDDKLIMKTNEDIENFISYLFTLNNSGIPDANDHRIIIEMIWDYFEELSMFSGSITSSPQKMIAFKYMAPILDKANSPRTLEIAILGILYNKLLGNGHTNNLDCIIEKRLDKNDLQENYKILTYITEELNQQIKLKDPVTYDHIDRMRELNKTILKEDPELESILIKEISEQLEKPITSKDLLVIIDNAIKFHDIGKLLVPDAILKWPARLNTVPLIIQQLIGKTGDQIPTIMKKHTDYGKTVAEYIEEYFNPKLFKIILEVVHWHHLDCTQVDKREKVFPTLLKYISVLDAYEAITTNKRTYKEGNSGEEAISIIKRFDSKFDPRITERIEDSLVNN